MVKKSELQKISDKTSKDSGYTKKMLTDYNFAKSELAKADMNLTQEQHNAISSLYRQATTSGPGEEAPEEFSGQINLSLQWKY